jgi:hypothetical protein
MWKKSLKVSATSGAETAYVSGAPDFSVSQSLDFCSYHCCMRECVYYFPIINSADVESTHFMFLCIQLPFCKLIIVLSQIQIQKTVQFI